MIQEPYKQGVNKVCAQIFCGHQLRNLIQKIHINMKARIVRSHDT